MEEDEGTTTAISDQEDEEGDEEEDGRQLFALHRPELDAAEDEKRQDGRKVDDHPGDEHPSVVLRGAVDQPEVGEDLWTNRGKVLLYRNKLEQAS